MTLAIDGRADVPLRHLIVHKVLAGGRAAQAGEQSDVLAGGDVLELGPGSEQSAHHRRPIRHRTTSVGSAVLISRAGLTMRSVSATPLCRLPDGRRRHRVTVLPDGRRRHRVTVRISSMPSRDRAGETNLPVQYPTKFELVVNPKTTKAHAEVPLHGRRTFEVVEVKFRRILKKSLSPFVVIAASIYFLIDALFFSVVKPLSRRLARLPIFTALASWIAARGLT
jgi:hypothetical protein